MAESGLLPLEVRLCQWVPGNTEPSTLCVTSSSDRTSQLASLEGHIHVVPFPLPPPPPPLPFASLLGSSGHFPPHDKLFLTKCVGYFSQHHHQMLTGHHLKRGRFIWLMVGEDNNPLQRGQSIRGTDGSAVAEAYGWDS